MPTRAVAFIGVCYVAGVSGAFLSQLTQGRSWRIGVDANENRISARYF
jgi:hypothetical protein